MKTIHLNLKGCYFDAIKDGSKLFEYRIAEKWERRLVGKQFDQIKLMRGYPKRGDESRTIFRKWAGYKIETITHQHFGPNPVRVLAIDVSRTLGD